MNVDEHIRHGCARGARLRAIGELARELGVSPRVVLSAGRRVVDSGLASPAYFKVHGVATLRGLAPSSPPAARAE